MDDLPAPIRLFRRDPRLNMARFYEIDLRPNLFAEITLVRRWGRIGTQGQTRFETFSDRASALTAGEALKQGKLRRGYSASSPKAER